MTMTIPEILQALEFFSEIFPREALEAAIANQEAIAPVLLEKLENLKGKFQDISEDYYFHVYSFFSPSPIPRNQSLSSDCGFND